MTRDIPKLIPQLDDGPASWSYFLHKCCTGSYKVNEMIYLAEWALMGKLVGYPIHEGQGPDDYDHVLSGQCSPNPPFPSKEELLRQLVQAAEMSGQVNLSALPRHDHIHYGSLWGRGIPAKPEDLLHDAVLHVWAHWSFGEYRRLADGVADEDPDYNSLHGLAAMILLISTFKDRCPEAFRDEFLSVE